MNILPLHYAACTNLSLNTMPYYSSVKVFVAFGMQCLHFYKIAARVRCLMEGFEIKLARAQK